MMAKLGRTFAELEPYALYPMHEYFYGEFRGIRSDRHSDSSEPFPERKSTSYAKPPRFDTHCTRGVAGAPLLNWQHDSGRVGKRVRYAPSAS